MKRILFIIFLFPVAAKSQLMTFFMRNDTLFSMNPSTGVTTQLTRLGATKTDVKDSLDLIRAALNTKQATITILPFANGGISGAAAASATSGTISLPMTSRIITVTPTGAITFNATGGIAGQMVTIYVTTSGTTSYTITFGTNFRKTGTLATGVASARYFAVSFLCIDGTIWAEIGRTAAQT